jgi:NAD(P)-dependent dehydrogenase (short-subunit alcohol dehydrogenase family)
MKNIVITGAGRGIGLALTELYLERVNRVAGTYRTATTAKGLLDLKAKYPDSLFTIELDVASESSISNASAPIISIFSQLDLLINNAGVLPDEQKQQLNQSNFISAMSTNVYGPISVTKSLSGLLAAAGSAVVCNVSSIMGSISQKSSSGQYAYSVSKAALNMATKMLSVELKGKRIAVISIHPGWVKTEMGGPNATLEVSESTEGIIKLLERVTFAETGKFLNWDGSEISW